MDVKVIFTNWSSHFLSATDRILRWLPSHQRWCSKLAGLPHETTLPPLAQRSLDSLESYLPIRHRWHSIYGLPESLAWRLWYHQRRTHSDRWLSTLRIYGNIRGNECVNCTARTWYKRPTPLHMDSSYHGSCQFDGSKIDPAKNDEDNFGLYASTNPKFRCTSNLSDTTQFWIDGK